MIISVAGTRELPGVAILKDISKLSRVVKSSSATLPLMWQRYLYGSGSAVALLLLVEKNRDGSAPTFSPVFWRYALPLLVSTDNLYFRCQ